MSSISYIFHLFEAYGYHQMNPAIAVSIRKRSLNRFARQVQKSDRSGFNSDRQGQSIDRNRRPQQHAKSPAGGRLLFRARLPPGGREGELPPAVSFQVDRSLPYNASGGGRGYGPCPLPAARQEADGGDHGKDLCRSFLRCIFLYFRLVRSSPFSSWKFLSGNSCTDHPSHYDSPARQKKTCGPPDRRSFMFMICSAGICLQRGSL